MNRLDTGISLLNSRNSMRVQNPGRRRDVNHENSRGRGSVRSGDCNVTVEAKDDEDEVQIVSPSSVAQVGPQNVIQVVTDNASNCASMGRKLEEEFPSIVWSPCASHCLDLLMKDIGKLEWIKSIISEATSIVDFINSKVRVLAIFQSYSDKELRKPSKTRFAATWILLDRLYEVQNKLQKTVVSEEFKEWMDGELIAQQQEAKSIQRLCLRESFWKNVYGIIAAILPLYKVLRMTDMEGATIGVLYHFMKEAIEEIKKCTTLDEPCDLSCDILDSTPKRDDILYLVEKRWKWMKRPIHGVAALLHPAFKEASLFMDTTLLEDRDTYLPKILSCEKHATFLQEFINYNDQRGIALASPIVWKRDSLVKPLFWWESFGYQMPLLQRIAMRVLAQDCSSGACERNWSAYSLIHTKIRNKLSTKQLERLIYCRSNLRMLRTMHQMPMARQVNVDSLKLSLETLKSVQKERDIEEEQIFCDLYLELEEIDRRVNRTRSHSKVTIRASRHRQRRGHSTSTIAYSRRGSGSRSAPSAMEDENEANEPREPSYDDDGNIISDGDYENVSIMSSSEEDNCTSSDE